MSTSEIAVLGVGMHKWGKFPEKSFVDIGVEATRTAMIAGLTGTKFSFYPEQILSGTVIRDGYQQLRLLMRLDFKGVK